MKTFNIVAALSALLLMSAGTVEARGCLKGAVVGGVGGHFVHHPVLGAVAGCAVGHHMAHRHDMKAANDAQHQHMVAQHH